MHGSVAAVQHGLFLTTINVRNMFSPASVSDVWRWPHASLEGPKAPGIQVSRNATATGFYTDTAIYGSGLVLRLDPATRNGVTIGTNGNITFDLSATYNQEAQVSS